jgi:hypothetical protein
MLFSQLRLPGFRCGRPSGRGRTAFRRLVNGQILHEILWNMDLTIGKLCGDAGRKLSRPLATAYDSDVTSKLRGRDGNDVQMRVCLGREATMQGLRKTSSLATLKLSFSTFAL